jgi:hypothetical protein
VNAAVAFAVASALHVGFQLTVTVLVYPALASRGVEEWAPAHARHSRAITPLVGVVYVALVATGVALVVEGPDLAGWLGLAGAAAAVGVTATLAAPLHGRLESRDEGRVRRLLLVDRWRCVAAVLGAVAALVAVLHR